MNILVTGVAGFLGSHVSERLIELGHTVIGLDDFSGGCVANIPCHVPFSKTDICDEAAIDEIVSLHKFDAIVHCAAFASENLSHHCRLHTYRSIVQGSATLVNAAVSHRVPLFVSMSSIAVYGHNEPPFYETDVAVPADPYGSAKLCMENDLKAAHEYFGLNYVIFRPHNIIGTRQSLADSTRNVASIFIRQALEKRPLTVFGDGMQTRAFSPVCQVARIIAHSVQDKEARNRTYNVGGNHAMSVLTLADTVLRLTGSPSGISYLPERKEAKHAFSSHRRVSKTFGAVADPRQTIEECLAEMINEAKSNPMPEFKSPPRMEIVTPVAR